jgi:hypothetical protein
MKLVLVTVGAGLIALTAMAILMVSNISMSTGAYAAQRGEGAVRCPVGTCGPRGGRYSRRGVEACKPSNCAK